MKNINELNPWMFRELLYSGEYAIRVESEDDIQKLAKRLGYSYAKYYCDFNDYQVYELLYDEPQMYAITPEMLFIQYKYARLDVDGEVKELQKAIHNLELPEVSQSDEQQGKSGILPGGNSLTDEIISLKSKVADKLHDLKEKLHIRQDETDDYWIDEEWDDSPDETC